MATTQAQAIAAAQQVIGFAQTMEFFRRDATEFLKKYASEGYSTYWNNLATAVPNADGSLGATDATPNPAHPITVSGINRSANALVAMVTFLNDFQAFLSNQAVSTGQRSQTLDDLVS